LWSWRARVDEAGLEPRADPEQQLLLVDGLGQEVGGARGESPAPGVGRIVGAQDHDGQVLIGRQTGPDLLDHVDAVAVGHVQVEQDQVGAPALQDGAYLAGIGRGHDVHVALVVEEAPQHHDVRSLVVHDQDPLQLHHPRCVQLPFASRAGSLLP
jgi:hypothetical protein